METNFKLLFGIKYGCISLRLKIIQDESNTVTTAHSTRTGKLIMKRLSRILKREDRMKARGEKSNRNVVK